MIDCFTFFNGLDILEIRLNSLAPYVDKFVLCESPFNMVGKSKPLYFGENNDRFKQFNITHLVVGDHERHMGGWEPYFYQIDYMMRGLAGVDPEEIVMLSDFDEIPDLTEYDGWEGAFRQRLYYYYLNIFTGDSWWKGTVAVRRKNFSHLSDVREKRNKLATVGRGWHFSYVCPVEDIIDKIESFCHQEFNTPEIRNGVAENKINLLDPFNRHSRKFTVEMPSGPRWLLDNKDKYEHLFYKC